MKKKKTLCFKFLRFRISRLQEVTKREVHFKKEKGFLLTGMKRDEKQKMKNTISFFDKKKVNENYYNPGLHPKRQLKRKATVGTRTWITEMNEGSSHLTAANLSVLMTLELRCLNRGNDTKGVASEIMAHCYAQWPHSCFPTSTEPLQNSLCFSLSHQPRKAA